MTIYVDLKKSVMKVGERSIRISCRVRNEVNGLRTLTERPVLSMPDGLPVMPRQFPAGKWEVYEPQKRTTKELAPFFIPTSAYRRLPVWSLVNGHYGEPTKTETVDRGYGIHYSEYTNTLGCIKVHEYNDIIWLANTITAARKKGRVFVEVTND